MLKKFLARRQQSGDMNLAWSEHAAPGVIKSIGLHPVSLALGGGVFVLFLLLFGALLALTPIGGVILTMLVLFLVGFYKLMTKLAPGAPVWIKGLLFVVLGDTVLNIGFSSITFNVGPVPLPIPDLLLGVAVAVALWKVVFGGDQHRLPAGVWVIFGWIVFTLALHLPFDFQSQGMAAARDGIRVAEFMAIVPAYVIARHALNQGETGVRWIKSFLLMLAIGLAIYGLCTPFQQTILNSSPGFSSWQKWVPVLGNFQSWPMAGLVGMFGVLLWRWSLGGRLSFWQNVLFLGVVFGALTAFAVLQSRAGYVFMALAVLSLAVVGGQGRQLLMMFSFLALCAVVLLGIEISGLELKGRVGKLTLSGITDHVLTLTGDSSNSEFHGAAGGIGQRKAWRDYSLRLWSNSVESRIVGIGFGQVLTDLKYMGENGEAVAVQDPHNSYVTTLTRAGLVGLTVLMSLFAWVLFMSVVGYWRARATNKPVAAFFLTLLMFQLYSMVDAWGEPHFEVSHYIVPSFFMYGVAWAVWDRFIADSRQKAVRKGAQTAMPGNRSWQNA